MIRWLLLLVCAAPLLAGLAEAGPPVILGTSLVRVHADNHFGVAKQHDIVPFLGLSTTDSISDTEMGTGATATCSATYNFSLVGDTATFAIHSQQTFSQGSFNNLAEGFVQFTLDEPHFFEVGGNFTGNSTDPGDAFQQRTFLRRFQSPFTTLYLEDETGSGTSVSLEVNQHDDTAGGSFNQFGPKVGLIGPGTYEFNYEMEGRDGDVDGVGTSTSSGSVVLTLRKQGPNSTLALHLNQTSFAPGQTMIVTVSLTPGTNLVPVDAYIVLRLPDQTLLAFTGQGVSTDLVPVARAFTPVLFAVEIFRYTFTGAEPNGSFDWFAALVEPGTTTVLGGVDQQSFTVGSP